MMRKRRLAKPKETIARIYRKPAMTLYEQYAEVQRLREAIRRLDASGTKVRQPDRS
jgi:hypothetical protein